MANIVSSNELMEEILDIFQLPKKHIRSVTIKLEAFDVAKIEILHYMDSDEAGLLKEVLKKHELKKRKLK